MGPSVHPSVRRSFRPMVTHELKPLFWKWTILGPLPPLPLPRFHSRFHKNVITLLVAIPPTYLEAVDKNNRFRFQNPG